MKPLIIAPEYIVTTASQIYILFSDDELEKQKAALALINVEYVISVVTTMLRVKKKQVINS